MGAILLDTTVLIDALRGRPAGGRLRSLRAAGDTPFTSAINIEELLRGCHPGEEAAVALLLDGLRLAVLGRRVAEQAAAWRRTFAAHGTTLSQADCLVAAAAAGVGARLATGNVKDFPMPGIVIEHWPVGQ
ncbi:MAG TPA: PIN domain-containing protein [Actinomycetota bacterium]|nr:PIN domain-containing protein [Actinomycetota bacterium]